MIEIKKKKKSQKSRNARHLPAAVNAALRPLRWRSAGFMLSRVGWWRRVEVGSLSHFFLLKKQLFSAEIHCKGQWTHRFSVCVCRYRNTHAHSHSHTHIYIYINKKVFKVSQAAGGTIIFTRDQTIFMLLKPVSAKTNLTTFHPNVAQIFYRISQKRSKENMN